jgi:hypothetical protein
MKIDSPDDFRNLKARSRDELRTNNNNNNNNEDTKVCAFRPKMQMAASTDCDLTLHCAWTVETQETPKSE